MATLCVGPALTKVSLYLVSSRGTSNYLLKNRLRRALGSCPNKSAAARNRSDLLRERAGQRDSLLTFKQPAVEVGVRGGYHPLSFLGEELEAMLTAAESLVDEEVTILAARVQAVAQLPRAARFTTRTKTASSMSSIDASARKGVTPTGCPDTDRDSFIDREDKCPT